MKNILKYIPGFRSGKKRNEIIATIYYAYCIYSIPSGFIPSIIWIAIPFAFFAIKENSKSGKAKENNPIEFTEAVELRKPIVFTKKLTGIVGACIVVLLIFGGISASAANKKNAQIAVEQKVKAEAQAIVDKQAQVIADAKAETQAIQDAKDAKAQAIVDKKAADAKVKADKVAYDTGITYNQLARTPDSYVGKKVKLSGTVVQVIEGDSETDLRIAVGGNYDTILLVAYDPLIVTSRILENDNVTVKGVSQGITTYKSTMGGDISLPAVTADSFN